jgi:hypothetical protein
MALYATYQTPGKDFERADTGEYNCTIKNIEQTELPSFNDQNIMEPKFRWIFETIKERTSEGEPFQFRKFTGVKYGNEKATLTLLINGVFERPFQPFEWPRVDLEKLIGQTVKVMVTLEMKESREFNGVTTVSRPRGKKFDNGAYMDAIGAPASTAKPVQEAADDMDDKKDPFRDS